jgi:HlyD family secretion protein
MFSKRTWIILGIVIAVLLIIVVVGRNKGWFGGSEATKVAVEKAAKRDITETVTATGKIYSKTDVKISPDVSGEIVELDVQEGDSVIKGQVLAKIKPDIYQAEVQQATAALNTAKAQELNAESAVTQSQAALDQQQLNFDRNKKLHDAKVIADADFEPIQSAYKSAQAALAGAQQQVEAAKFNVESADANLTQANENLYKTTIYAPMSGIVSQLEVEKGERVVGTTQFAGTEMMTISDLYSIEARVDVSENDVLKIKVGDTADVELDAYPDRKFKAVVTQMAVSASSFTSDVTAAATTDQVINFTVKVQLARGSYKDLVSSKTKEFPFLPGMSATVTIMTKKISNILAVPIQSVTTREDTSTKKNSADTSSQQEVVFVVTKSNHVKQKNVKTGIQDDKYIQITDGLDEGEQVVSAPYSAISKDLKDSSSVKVVPKDQVFVTPQD